MNRALRKPTFSKVGAITASSLRTMTNARFLRYINLAVSQHETT